MKYSFDVNSIEELKYLACTYGKIQIFHGLPNANPIAKNIHPMDQNNVMNVNRYYLTAC